MSLVASLLFLALAAPPEAVKVERYRLQSNRWVNLHQRLLYAARFEPSTPKGLTSEETAAWDSAVGVYRQFLGKRSPIYDRELIEMNAALSQARGTRPPETIPEPARGALARAMTLYEKQQWAEDDFGNRFWIAVARPLLESAGAELLAAHARAYGVPFPKRILVDVAAFGWEFGAYTVGDSASVHCVIQSTDPGSQGFAALESLMHEPSHGIVEPASGAVGADLVKAAAELNRKVPYNLWHGLLFYTAGELTRKALARRGVEYEPIIYRGMFTRVFVGFQEPFEAHWRAYLDGKETREEAIRQIVLATGKPAE
ncbi:MAG TPA: hypothetical protein VFW45_06465 [Candidatus Polarisedimenticolia bacterium]|nr:hypothetical protein [Candidatus Polarisedimenticolia bacterium]